MEILKEIHEEKRRSKELQLSFREEVQQFHQQAKDLHQRMVQLATEAEMEIKSSGSTLSAELDRLLADLSKKVDVSVEDITRHRSSISALIQKAQRERQFLSKSVTKAEKLIQFFKSKVPVEEVLEEIEDKKYLDARHLLAKGLSVEEVATEIGLPISEVNLLATVI
ncbi:MAG: hypothetical protein ACOH5I_23665 [Oligoflexus sp.]